MGLHASIVVLPGDGIGPDVVAEGIKVLRAVERRFGHTFDLTEALIGGCAIDAYGVPIRPEDIAIARKADAILLGAIGGPKWDNPNSTVRPEQGLLAIRKELGLYANLRPVAVMPAMVNSAPIKPELLEGVDVMVVRELTGGLYFSQPSKIYEENGQRAAVDTLIYHEHEIARVARLALQLARERRNKVASVDKANVLSSSRLWRTVVTEIHKAEFSDVELEHILVDSMTMHLIRQPARFDVIVTENMFGDILTDEASVLAGSIGLLPSASLGESHGGQHGPLGLYEPIHGSAPDIAGQGKANPCGTILSVAMLLQLSLGLHDEAAAVETAVRSVIEAGIRTADCADGGPVSTTAQVGDAIANAVA